MSVLNRYQKPGGFVQLLKTIETCGRQKQENFLSMIEKEDPRWAVALRTKMLSIEKILSWNNDTLAEVAGRLSEITLATALHGLTEEDWGKLSHTFSHSQKRKIEDLKNEKTPTPADISAAFLKILEEVRGLISGGYVRVERFAPELVIDDEIEERIQKSEGLHAMSTPSVPDVEVPSMPTAHAVTPMTPASAPSGAPHPEMATLVAKMNLLQKELQTLRNENKSLKDKLNSIKKMAA